VTHASKNSDGSATPDLLQFIHQTLSGLSKTFAEGPLMSLRVSTPDASVTLVKSAGGIRAISEDAVAERHRGAWPMHAYLPDGEPGRAYDTVNADVVGIFHAAPDAPAPGETIEADRVLGYIEALKVRTPVRSGISGRVVGQVAENGQAVDFGETLFVVDSGAPQPAVEQAQEEIEPPRI
jgi:biotin carboxyl carrier protein